MIKPSAIHPADLLGASRLAVEATSGISELVEAMHCNIAQGPPIFGPAVATPAEGIAGLVYQSVRAVTGLVGGGIEAVLGPLVPLVGERSSHPHREAVLAALNGLLGDHLAATRNPLAISMELRRENQPLVLERRRLAASVPAATSRLLVLVHGLCMGDQEWSRNGHDHGTALAQSLGFTPVYLRYNSGLHVSTNGRALAELLETLNKEWPRSVKEIVLIGHSMGGLLIRSAYHYASATGPEWRRRVGKMIFLGTPHHGTPLERAGNWMNVALDASPYTTALARLGKTRSAGITDLRFGNVLDEDWQGRNRFDASPDERYPVPLPEGVESYAMAADTGRGIGDGLVPVDSALGRHSEPARTLTFGPSQQWIGQGIGHFDLLSDGGVYEQIKQWLE